MNWQQPIPKTYSQLPQDELIRRITERKEQLGTRLVILGHHYQQDDVVRFADYIGDSFQLSREAAKLDKVEYILFCGVHFMAESADILTENKIVILPDLGAGCSMADMAQTDDVDDAWEAIHQASAPGLRLVPITYMNSSAALKAFVGAHGGAVCTSSNAAKVMRWAFNVPADGPLDIAAIRHSNTKLLFFPDQHLGRNTAASLGFPLDSMEVWNYFEDNGGLTDQQIADATFFLWQGHCSVHQLFRPEHVDDVRRKMPGVTVIVHPECNHETVLKADISGSTDLINKTITAAPPGSKWAVGTEVHMVSRLAKNNPDKQIVILSECQCLCTTMYRIDAPHMLWALDNLAQGKVVNQVRVKDETKHQARIALQRMLDITAGKTPTTTTTAPQPVA